MGVNQVLLQRPGGDSAAAAPRLGLTAAGSLGRSPVAVTVENPPPLL